MNGKWQMPGTRSKHQRTAKANRMAQHIENHAREEGRYKGREERVAWATVHKEAERRRPQEIIQGGDATFVVPSAEYLR